MSEKTYIAYGQFHVRFGNWDANAARITEIAAAAQGASLLVLPELAFSGYDFPGHAAARKNADAFHGRTREFLSSLSRQHHMTVIAGYAEDASNALYNSSMLVNPDGSAANYRKLHLFNREQDFFTPGDAPPPVVDTPIGKVGLMICFDWFFPEVARSLALRGAEIIAHPSNLVLPWCQRAMFARSVENGVFTVTCNRIGTEEEAGRSLTFTGASQILSPRGETLAQAPVDEEHVGIAEVDLAQAREKTIAERNDLFIDRRPEMYVGVGEYDF